MNAGSMPISQVGLTKCDLSAAVSEHAYETTITAGKIIFLELFS